MLFAAAGKKFEDNRIEFADWPKVKPSKYKIFFEYLSISFLLSRLLSRGVREPEFSGKNHLICRKRIVASFVRRDKCESQPGQHVEKASDQRPTCVN